MLAKPTIQALEAVILNLREEDEKEVKKFLELELEIIRLKSGIEALVERVKEKDVTIKDYREVVEVLKGLIGGKKPEQKQN